MTKPLPNLFPASTADREFVPARKKVRRPPDLAPDGEMLSWTPTRAEELYGDVDVRAELGKCYQSVTYFADKYVWIFNATSRGWVKLKLWPAQREVLEALHEEQYVIVLKARQLGMSWLTLTYALWLMVMRPAASLLMMSKREDEAIELLSNRLTGMYHKLPPWLQAGKVLKETNLELALSNGSSARGFSTGGGRSYTATMALLDEADFVPNLNEVLNALKPTIDAGGKMVMVSTPDKTQPMSPFKQIFRAALKEENNYLPIFLPWNARPSRTISWYHRIAKDMRSQNGSNDDLWQEYPATVEEALAPRQLDKRISQEWVARCSQLMEPIEEPDGAPALAGALRVYAMPEEGRRYVIGADPAEGNPRSDDSVAVVLDYETWEEVCCWSGKIEPDGFATGIARLSGWYGRAQVMVERNNHGHAVILGLRKEHHGVRLMEGHDTPGRKAGQPAPIEKARKWGWLQNMKGKPLMYDFATQALRDGECVIHTQEVALQLADIESETLSAPEGMHDDFATAFALAIAACCLGRKRGEELTVVEPVTPEDVVVAADREEYVPSQNEGEGVRSPWITEVERWMGWKPGASARQT